MRESCSPSQWCREVPPDPPIPNLPSVASRRHAAQLRPHASLNSSSSRDACSAKAGFCSVARRLKSRLTLRDRRFSSARRSFVFGETYRQHLPQMMSCPGYLSARAVRLQNGTRHLIRSSLTRPPRRRISRLQNPRYPSPAGSRAKRDRPSRRFQPCGRLPGRQFQASANAAVPAPR